MPAYFDTGFSVREPMWHGLGLVLDEYPESWADARQKAGLLWEPEERPAFAKRAADTFSTCRHCEQQIGATHDEQCPFWIDGIDAAQQRVIVQHALPADAVYVDDQTVFVRIPDHKLIVRNDTELVLGVTSDSYSAIYHADDAAEANDGASMEEVIEAFRGADGSLKFETAGSVRDGRAVWALLYLDEPYTLPGDSTEHLPFVALLNRHDGTGAMRLVNTQVRVVCWNTFQMAEADGDQTGRTFSFRHTGDVKTRVDEAKAAIAGLRNETAEYVAMCGDLMSLRVDDGAVARFLSEFLPSPRENGEQCSDRVHANVEKARQTWRWLYEESPTTEGIRGTGYGILQSSTEYLDHARAFRTRDSYLGRSVLRAEPAKARALQLVRAL